MRWRRTYAKCWTSLGLRGCEMPDYTSITIRKEAENEYQKAKIGYESKMGKKITALDFFELLVSKFKEVVLNGADKKDV